METCIRCERTLPREAFTVNRTRESGLSMYCRECNRQRRLARGEMKPEGWVRKTADMKAYQREWRKANRDKILRYEKNRPLGFRKARSAVKDAVKSGKLVRQPCFVCGEKAEAHHPSYDLPLDVTWLCADHHRAAHALTRELEKLP